jgi:hypothetical protein
MTIEVDMRFKLILLFTCLILLSALLTGCDSTLDIKGRIFEWLDAPSNIKGDVYIMNVSDFQNHNVHINETPPQGYNLQPIPNVKVSFWYESKGEYFPIRGGYPTSQSNVISSDTNGIFKEFWIVAPGKYNLKIIVEKDGYYPIERIFPFNGGDPGTFDFTVLLVHEPKD